jgi:predicted Zn-dependent peptidase
MPFHSQTLSNGLQIIGESHPAALSTAVGFFVRTGSRDETPEISGVSHFLEHMVFKGTPRRTALDVNRDFDRIGAHYNAFTSEENTVFWAAILPEYLPQAVDILADILRPSLRGEDFDMEKKVIIEEIGMYDDQPTWAAYDKAKMLYFADHPLGNSILGTAESVGGLKRDQMLDYFSRRYVGPNVMVAVAGRFDWQKLVADVEQQCGSWPTGTASRQNIRETDGSGSFQVVPKNQVKQEHIFLIASGPPANSPLRYAAEVIGVVVGDDSNSRLYWALVDPGLVESADMSYHEYEGTGSFFTSFSCEPGKTAANLATVERLLRELQKDGITAEELTQAKSKLGSRVVRAHERPVNRMRSIGMNWTYLHEYRTIDDDLQAFDAVTLKDVREVLDRYPVDRLTTLALGPLQDLKSADRNGQKK